MDTKTQNLEKNCSWAVVIPTYGRLERLFTCLSCLVGAAKNLGTGVQLILLNNSPNNSVKYSAQKFLTPNFSNLNFVYADCVGLNQSEMRNHALTLLSSSVDYVLFLDSDIYLSAKTLLRCNLFLEENPDIVALGPPLAPYYGGKHGIARSQVVASVQTSGLGLITPSLYDFETFAREGEFLTSLMIRGVFIVRRNILFEIFNGKPWQSTFKVWQNVPFFLSLREIDKKFGYLLDPEIIALHDERKHPDTIASFMDDFSVQTLKSLCLLFHRNQLWKKEQRLINERFIHAMTKVVEKHVSHSSREVAEELLKIAECLSENQVKGHELLAAIGNTTKYPILANVIELLLAEYWKDISNIKSLDLSKPM